MYEHTEDGWELGPDEDDPVPDTLEEFLDPEAARWETEEAFDRETDYLLYLSGMREFY